jgi:protease PrsW
MKARWLQVLVTGSLLFVAFDTALRLTGDNSFVPVVTILGSFVVPVTMTVYFYGHIRDRDISPPMLANAFIIGGAIGITAAAVLELSTLKTLSVPSLVAVGVIEESAKMIFPVAIFSMGRYRHEADGLLFGVASGMGFAALETISYGIGALIDSRGDIGALEQVLLLRGLLSPAGHAAWTGLVCSVLWRQREKERRVVINPAVFGFFLLAISLHFAWNVVSMLNLPALLSSAGLFVVAAVSLGLLIARYREARRNLPEPAATSQFAGSGQL